MEDFTDFTDFMAARLQRTIAYHEASGRRVQLTLGEYMELHSYHQLENMRTHFGAGTICAFLNSKWGYVLGWRSRADFEAGVLNRHTARVMPRETSKTSMPMRKGSQHSTAAKEKISRKLKGKKQRADHVEKRAAAQRGTKRGPMSEEHKAAIRAGRARSC